MIEPLANKSKIRAEFDRLSVGDKGVATVMRIIGTAGSEACFQWFNLGYMEGQSDALRYHNEQMTEAKERAVRAPVVSPVALHTNPCPKCTHTNMHGPFCPIAACVCSAPGVSPSSEPLLCSQCGQPFDADACGPTHALIAHERITSPTDTNTEKSS